VTTVTEGVWCRDSQSDFKNLRMACAHPLTPTRVIIWSVGLAVRLNPKIVPVAGGIRLDCHPILRLEVVSRFWTSFGSLL
jgi:hypothetical protein